MYGSGFAAADAGLAYSAPLTFLTLRFAISALLLLIVSKVTQSPWPDSWRLVAHTAIAGLLIAGVFSIGTWISMAMGLSPAVSALIIALQPLLVSIIASMTLNERVKPTQWLGFGLGLVGVILVVGEHVTVKSGQLTAVLFSVLGLIGLTIGNIYQKKFCTNVHVFTGGCIQSAISALACLPLAYFIEPLHIEWTRTFVVSLLWMSCIVSIGALSLLYWLLKQKSANSVSSTFYLLPVVTAALSYILFDATVSTVEGLGMLIAALGVSMVNLRRPKNAVFLQKFVHSQLKTFWAQLRNQRIKLLSHR